MIMPNRNITGRLERTVNEPPATPTNTAQACGLWHGAGETSLNLTWDIVLDRAVAAYWARRPAKQEAA